MSDKTALRWFFRAALSAGVGLSTLAAAGGFANAAELPEAAVGGAGSANAIDGSYIVVLKDETAKSPGKSGDHASDVAKAHNAKLGQTFTAALNGFTAKMDAKAARQMAADPLVD